MNKISDPGVSSASFLFPDEMSAFPKVGDGQSLAFISTIITTNSTPEEAPPLQNIKKEKNRGFLKNPFAITFSPQLL
jgi:hypothetical protein